MANTSTRGILLTMLSAVTFGFAFTLGPMTYGEAGSNPVTLTFLRNFLSLPVLLAILWYQGISLQVSAKELWSLTILGGIGNAVTTLMLFIAFSLIDVGVATTIHFIYPVFVTIGCVLFYKERLGLQKFIALLIATAGIACFFLGVDMSAGFSGGTFLGLFLAVASGVTYAFYHRTHLPRRYVSRYAPDNGSYRSLPVRKASSVPQPRRETIPSPTRNGLFPKHPKLL